MLKINLLDDPSRFVDEWTRRVEFPRDMSQPIVFSLRVSKDTFGGILHPVRRKVGPYRFADR